MEMNPIMKTTVGAPKSWYREPWPWLLMSGPALVVVAGFITLWLAVQSDDGLVAGDYYKRGLAINQVLSREAEARARRLRGEVTISADAGRMRIALAGDGLPRVLRLSLFHPTRAGLDRELTLPAVAAGVYEGPVTPLPAGRWRLIVEDGTASWRLAGDWQAPGQTALQLVAQ